MTSKKTPPFDAKMFLSKVNGGRTIANYRKDQIVYTQGDPADSVFYVQAGKIKKVVVSAQGKEAVVALFGTGDFFGEGCLNGEALRLATVSAMTDCVVVRLPKETIIRMLHEEPAFSELFIAHLLHRNSRVEEDLVDQLFNSSEKRLARTLLILANFGKEARADPGENQSRDAGRYDRDDAIARQCFHEQVSAIGSYRLQRPHRSPPLVVERSPAREAAY